MGHDAFPFSFGCPGHVNRRQFLAGCTACAAGMSAMSLAGKTAAAAAVAQTTKPAAVSKPRIALVYSHIKPDTPTWPNIGYDYEGRKKELTALLQQKCPNVDFQPATVQNAEEAKQLLANTKDVDGYLVYLVGIWTGAPAIIASSGKPTIMVDDLYAGSGEFLIAYAGAKRAGQKVVGVSSTKFDDVVEAVRCIDTMKKLQASNLLVLATWDTKAVGQQIKDTFGTSLIQPANEELDQLYAKVDQNEARKIARNWIGEAEKVVEPSKEEIEKSAAMYVAMRDLMQRYDARAITIACLHLFYGGKLGAYPCLGFWQLNNDGFVGACEADLHSTITMLVMSYLTGRPGFISDPVIDTAKNQVIYAHCVAPTRVFGPDGAGNPYHIRSHSEDRKGASIRSLMPLGEMTTTILFESARKEMIIHQGKTVENIDEDKACRTKLAAEVADARKLLDEWDRWGWHRVTFYGDHRVQLENLCSLMGIKVIQEG
ncbi:MAG TPA: hypothetical protein VLM89_08770 [Phycisphaerae bacterium]|nr:hypothetical protein [Phycisphaerae bacterium]